MNRPRQTDAEILADNLREAIRYTVERSHREGRAHYLIGVLMSRADMSDDETRDLLALLYSAEGPQP